MVHVQGSIWHLNEKQLFYIEYNTGRKDLLVVPSEDEILSSLWTDSANLPVPLFIT